MSTSSFRHMVRWLLLIGLLLATLPNATRAQEETPVPSPTPEQSQIDTSTLPADIHDYVIVDPHAPSAQPSLQSASPAVSEASNDVNTLDITAGVQGDIKVDVAVNDTVRAGNTLQYTYVYTNTRTSPANIVLRTTWSDFKVGANQTRQSCTAAPDPHPGCEPFNVSGPAVTKQTTTKPCTTADSGPLCYSLTLPAGQKGSFVVQIGVLRTSYPQTNNALYRPSGSVQLFLDTGGDRISEDTANSLIIGPVLILTKKAVDPAKKVFPVKSVTPRPAESEIAEFSLIASNATGKNDSPGGAVRSDAINATNITIVDSFPAGAEFIEATGNPTVDTTRRTVTWVIAGPLKPGASLPEVRVKYVKTDVNVECGVINNNTLNVTSDEYPIGTAGNPPTRLAVAGISASTPVITPVVIDSITPSPAKITFGDSATFTILVKSAWTQPISGLKLSYSIQSNAVYVPNSGSSGATVDTTGAGPTLNWTFDMPAASNRNTPQTKEFKFTVQGGYTEAVKYGQAQVTLPATVPSACTKAVTKVVPLVPRLSLTKKIIDALPSYGNIYYTTQKTEVHYQIEVINDGNADASNIDVKDLLPGDIGANFRYKGGSATVNGTPITPQVSDGIGGTIVWDNISVGAESKATIGFTLIVDGLDYVKYCNNASATINDSTDERIIPPGAPVCVKFNPDIEITKTVNGGTATVTAQPGDTVTFKLTMTNHESVAYDIGLYDSMGRFTFKSMKSGYDMSPTFDGNNIQWQRVSVAPGETKAVEFTASVPTSCSTTDYLNEALFYNKDFIIQPVPRILTHVKVGCGIEYAATASTGQASLDENLVYSLRVTNKNTVEVKNIVVTNTLPLGFTFVRMDGTSDVSDMPKTSTLEDGRIQQRWTIGSISGGKIKQIKIAVRSTTVVGKWLNQMVVEGGTCAGNCQTDGTSGAPITVTPLITSEPKITSTTTACATPNDTLVYQVAIANTNSHAYANTAVTVTLPLGLSFVKPISNTATPSILPLNTGASQVVWRNMTIPAKSGSFSQVVLTMQLKVGNVLGNLSAQVQANSTDGAIPRKEGVVDPTISVCLPNPAVAKLANALTVKPNGDIVYDIILANPKSTSITATIEDQLPAGLKYSSAISETGNIEPTLSNNDTKLTWTDITIPPAQGNLLGEVHLRFTVTGTTDKIGQQYKNTATVVKSSETLDVSRASYTVTIARQTQSIYLPLMRKK